MTSVPAHRLPTPAPGRHHTVQSAADDAIPIDTPSSDFSRRLKLLVTALPLAVLSGAVGAAAVVLTVGTDHADTSTSNDAAGVADNPLEHAVAQAIPSVVKLTTKANFKSDEGSGIVLTADGLILTNSHVVSSGDDAAVAAKTEATFADGRTAPFTVVGADPVSDVAVVRAQGVSGLTTITLGSAANLRVGEHVVAIGAPLGLDSTVTAGIVSALHRPIRTVTGPAGRETVLDAIQTDAAINPGSSGGALIDTNGNLVGINSLTATVQSSIFDSGGSIGVGFAIPIDQAKRIADELIATGTASHPYLGVQLANDSNTRGATVIEARSGGPAASAGLVPDTVITGLDGRLITSSDALLAAILSKAPGDAAEVTYSDAAGASHTVAVILGSDRD